MPDSSPEYLRDRGVMPIYDLQEVVVDGKQDRQLRVSRNEYPNHVSYQKQITFDVNFDRSWLFLFWIWHVIAPKAFLMVKSEIFSYKNADFLETHRKTVENQGFGIVAG